MRLLGRRRGIIGRIEIVTVLLTSGFAVEVVGKAGNLLGDMSTDKGPGVSFGVESSGFSPEHGQSHLVSEQQSSDVVVVCIRV